MGLHVGLVIWHVCINISRKIQNHALLIHGSGSLAGKGKRQDIRVLLRGDKVVHIIFLSTGCRRPEVDVQLRSRPVSVRVPFLIRPPLGNGVIIVVIIISLGDGIADQECEVR